MPTVLRHGLRGLRPGDRYRRPGRRSPFTSTSTPCSSTDCTVADTIGQICQNVPGCEPDPDHDPFKYRERLGPASPPQTLPQPLPAPLNRRNLRFGYKEDVFCPEGCKPKED